MCVWCLKEDKEIANIQAKCLCCSSLVVHQCQEKSTVGSDVSQIKDLLDCFILSIFF